ncbi:MAG TPA: LytTR family DNA-binding domain-containing protein [Candidatus Angelobacter sp.]|nr:LytTR family DNA-binding domain-containing protein [Candidatus Angelobacter sp.]
MSPPRSTRSAETHEGNDLSATTAKPPEASAARRPGDGENAAEKQKIRVLIVDDEPLARSNIASLLRRDAAIEIMSECGSGAEALTEIRNNKPDLVFLDVQMPECDGFDVLEQLGADAPCAIVFVTAYDQYALRAFETGALDYLLKPFDNARFDRALSRAKEKILQSRSAAGNTGVRKAGKQAKEATERFVIKSTGQVLFIKASEVDWIEAADYYVCLHTGSKTHLLRRSLSELEQELDQGIFCRIHRSTIVNLDRVRSLELNEEGEHEVLLKDGVRLRLSRTYRKQLQTRLGLCK